MKKPCTKTNCPGIMHQTGKIEPGNKTQEIIYLCNKCKSTEVVSIKI